MAIYTTLGDRVTPVQAAKLLVVYGGVTADLALDEVYNQVQENFIQLGITKREYEEIKRHIPKQIDRVLKLLGVEHLW